jgi:hypothetical protein
MSLSLLEMWESQIAASLVHNLTDIRAAMPKSSDPLVRDSFRPTIDNGLSPQQRLTDAPYSKNNLYSDTRPNNTLLFFSGDPPKSLIPQQGNLYSDEYYKGNIYNPKNTYAPIATSVPVTSLNSLDVFAMAHWARNIAQEFGIIQRPGDNQGQRATAITKGLTFAATQFLLTTFNPADPQNGGLLNLIYNPLSLPASFIPGLRGNALSSPNLPAFLSGDGKVYSNNALSAPDRHLLMREGLYSKTPNASDLLHGNIFNPPGFIGDIARPGQADILGARQIPGVTGVPINAQVDQEGILGAFAADGPFMTNLYTQKSPYSMGPAIDNE